MPTLTLTAAPHQGAPAWSADQEATTEGIGVGALERLPASSAIRW